MKRLQCNRGVRRDDPEKNAPVESKFVYLIKSTQNLFCVNPPPQTYQAQTSETENTYLIFKMCGGGKNKKIPASRTVSLELNGTIFPTRDCFVFIHLVC